METETILVPLDGSELAEAALRYAAAIAKAKKARLRLISVINFGAERDFAARAGLVPDFVQRLESEAGHYLSGKVAALTADEIEASSAVLTGYPTEEILREAEEAGVAMIAMATHGRNGLERWTLGSVADKVMRLSTRPTLLVRPPEEGVTPARVRLRRIVVPLDGSPLAEAAVEPAAELAEASGATLVFLLVEPWLSSQLAFSTEGMYVPDLADLEHEAETAAKEYLEGIRRRVPQSVRTEAVVLRGLIDMQLQDYLERDNVDLAVMSTHGRGGFIRFVLGSKADRLVRAGVPSLLIHPVAAAENTETEAPVAAVTA